jgi:hypothetical protein
MRLLVNSCGADQMLEGTLSSKVAHFQRDLCSVSTPGQQNVVCLARFWLAPEQGCSGSLHSLARVASIAGFAGPPHPC